MMIKIENLSFSYGNKEVIKNFTLEINKGDRICFFGKSGCGKTTLLRLILGLEKPSGGAIVTENNLKPSVVFQENRLLPFKTVIENITLFGASVERAEASLKALGIFDCRDKIPRSLSGGMKQRVAIARAISCEFDYLVLDEPFTGLDGENISLIAAQILDICGDKPILLVTHSLEEAALLGAKIVEM